VLHNLLIERTAYGVRSSPTLGVTNHRLRGHVRATMTEAESRLTTDAREHINRHLWRLAGYFGITNLAAIAIGLSYIFLVLPRNAANEAAAQTRSEIQMQISTLTQEVIKLSADAIRETGSAQGRAKDLAESNKQLEQQIEEVKRKFDNLKGTSAEQVAELITKLQATPDLGKNIDLISAVRAVETRLNAPTKPVTSQGYGRSAWINTVRTATCPVGQIAVGLDVQYGGTCNSQCNADGGAIQEIRVLCRAL
jgi:predicted transcriptional regulator